MIPYPRQALSELCFRQRDMEKGAKFQLCFVLLCTAPFTYPSRWRHKSMHSCNSLAADTVLCTHGKKTWLVCSSQLFYACQSYVIMYCMVYCILALVTRYCMYCIVRNCIVAALRDTLVFFPILGPLK